LEELASIVLIGCIVYEMFSLDFILDYPNWFNWGQVRDIIIKSKFMEVEQDIAKLYIFVLHIHLYIY
jgi:hypothetical protein